jgi:D-lyxose ketol-isomerase
MKRSALNAMTRMAENCFKRERYALPPGAIFEPTDFGMGKPNEYALVEVMLGSWAEYSERLMFARKGWITPCHCHNKRKEDIICRWGQLEFRVWPSSPAAPFARTVKLPINNKVVEVESGAPIRLSAGERITMIPPIYHEFFPLSEECIIGEVGNAVDEQHDNFFADPTVELFKPIEEDEPAYQPLSSPAK